MIEQRLKELKRLAPSTSVARRLVVQWEHMNDGEFEALIERLTRRKKDDEDE